MIRLNLTAAPAWLTLAPGLRLQVAPLTTALMVSARADPAIEALPDTATQEELALAMAKAVARRAVLDWEGVGDDAGNIVPVTPEGGLTFEDGISGAGKYVELVAHMDIIVLISNCPQLNNPCNGYNPTPAELLVWD